MAFPNNKFESTFFKAQRKSPFKTLPVHSMELYLINHDVVQALDSLYAAFDRHLFQYTISVDN